jgi:putative salt-induced outer membrane protein YdiY
MRTRTTARRVGLALALLTGTAARADEVLFNNGDRISGKVLSVEDGKMTIDSKLAGEIKVDMKDVKTFTTDAPIEIRTKDGQKMTSKATAGEAGTVKVDTGTTVAPPKTVSVDNMKYINFSEAWTGSVVAGALFTRGNSYTDQANVAFDLTRRTDQDRWIFTGQYNFGRQRDQASGDKFTSVDNWTATGEYDYFLTPRLYLFGSMRYEHDRIANLDYRLTPGFGVGYQWIDQPDLKFSTEAGLAYVCEHFEDGSSNDFIAGKLAYHVLKKFNDKVELFHNVEYYPSLERLDDYLLITDAGVRATLTKKMFAEYKIEFRYDSTPAEGASHSDLRHIVGVGWKF